jgi:MscS family membrane protein
LLTAAGKGDFDTAAQYLNVNPRQRGQDAVKLAQELVAVLNQRLPARLNEISDKPEGSLKVPNDPDKELVGTISGEEEDFDVIVERIHPKGSAPIWLFSQKTLRAIPDLYAELESESTARTGLAKFLFETRIAHIALIHWVALLIALPLLYVVGARLNRLLSRSLAALLYRIDKKPHPVSLEFLSAPVRLLLTAAFIRWALTKIALPLLAREFWYGIAVLLTVVGIVWLLIAITGWFEGKIRLRLGRENLAGALSILRFVRSAINAFIIFAGLLVLLHYFGFDPTTVLAGLGVGGIAVALAAQKTLENVIAGVSLISDKAIRVGDFLKIGTTLGTVNDIGLRSTIIRTLDRTVVNVPNGQIANSSLENMSLRDSFWFHPTLRLTYDTTGDQLRSVLADITNFLTQRAEVDRSSARARLLNFAESSLEIEVFAYVKALDYVDFLRIQEDLMLHMMGLVETAGLRFAVPARNMYLNALPSAQNGTQTGIPFGVAADYKSGEPSEVRAAEA